MRTWTCFLGFLLALLSASDSYASPHSGSLLYPFGEAHGDMKTDIEDDGSTEQIALTHSFTFFNEKHRGLYVNNNGAISFKGKVSDYTPDAFPIAEFCMICPFWGDVDNECGGTIFYRQSKDEELLELLSNDIKKCFEDLKNFIAAWCFIATWDGVAYHGSESNKTNSFQVLLVADGSRSIVMFNYDDIQWTTGTASGGHPLTGLGGTPAQVGFNTGTEYFNMPLSRTEHVINIKTTSNVGIPGRWVFRVDEFRVPGGCMHLDSFLNYGQTIWTEESCKNRCSCKRSGKVECEESPCEEGFTCMASGRHFMCQIDEEDC